jgi:intracellular sulfur oxidation DsrE/DsrF family protein
MKTEEQIAEFLKSIHIDNVDIMDFVNIDEIDHDNPAESIFDMINDNNGFEVEIVYYSNAIEYLKRNDPSLSESMEIATQYDYKLYMLNSEVLASLHASQKSMCDYWDYQDEINNFFI